MSRIPFELGDTESGPEGRHFVASGRRFHLLELIGRGSFGDVYLADQESDGGFRRRVVLKVLNDDVATLRSASRQMRNEARVLGLLVHRHIVTVLDLVRFEDRWAILMDFVPGADLERVLDALELRPDEAFPVPAALEVGTALAEALHAAIHSPDGQGGLLSVVHRDIKPSNVQLTPDGEVKVLDFGIARFSLDGRPDAARRVWMGTERYMGPERIRCEGDTPAGDVYATGATVIELLLGRPLGRTPVLAEEHRALVEEALKLVRTRIDADPHVVDQILDVLRRSVHAEPGQRPTAQAFARTLETLSGRVRGETLKQFSRRFVPTIDTLLGRKSVPASGTLREGTTSRNILSEPEPTVQPGANRTPTDIATPHPLPLARLSPRTPVPVASPSLPPAPSSLPPMVVGPPPGPGWLPFALHVGGIAAGAVGGVVIGPAVAVALMMMPSSSVEAEAEQPAPEPVVAAVPAPEELVVDVAPHSADPFGRTLLGAPLFPGSRPDLVAVVINPSGLGPAAIPEIFVTVEDATAVRVTCGEVTGVARGTAHLVGLVPGSCLVETDWLGSRYTTELPIAVAGRHVCRVENRVLRCS